ERRLCWQSYDYGEDRWSPIFSNASGHVSGDVAPAGAGAEPTTAHLGRVTYDYNDLSGRLFEEPLDLHYARIIHKKLLRIDHEARRRLPDLAAMLPPGSDVILD